MAYFKSYIKSFFSILFAILLIVIFETIAYIKNGKDNIISNAYLNGPQPFLYLEKETAANGAASSAYIRRWMSYKSDPEFLQIGDSSGIHGVKQNVISGYLNGMKYFNASTGAPVGWDSYFIMANDYLKRFESIKYLVLHINLYSLPYVYDHRYGVWKHQSAFLAIDKTYNSLNKYISFIPSMYYRPKILDMIYYSKNFKYKKFNNPEDNSSLLKINDANWIPREDNKIEVPSPIGECQRADLGENSKPIEHRMNTLMLDGLYDQNGSPAFAKNLKKLKGIVDKYDKKLILIISPVSCYEGEKVKPLRDDFEIFKNKNPDVYIPFDLFTTWGSNYFADPWHLLPKGAKIHSDNIGKALSEIIK